MEQKIYSGVVVKFEQKCLLCKRNNIGSLPGKWSIPGGKNEEGEETLEAAKREFYEETFIDIDNDELNFVGVVPRKTRDGKKHKGVMYVYQLNSDQELNPDLENAIDGSEHTECGYFKFSEIDKEDVGQELYKLLKNILKK